MRDCVYVCVRMWLCARICQWVYTF